jgi:uncharacterized oligopeptide transporter (OPT) family protein
LKIGGDIWQAMSLKEQSLNVEKETLHAATHEAQTAGGVIGGSSVVGLVTAFIIGRKGKQDKPAASPP